MYTYRYQTHTPVIAGKLPHPPLKAQRRPEGHLKAQRRPERHQTQQARGPFAVPFFYSPPCVAAIGELGWSLS